MRLHTETSSEHWLEHWKYHFLEAWTHPQN